MAVAVAVVGTRRKSPVLSLGVSASLVGIRISSTVYAFDMVSGHDRAVPASLCCPLYRICFYDNTVSLERPQTASLLMIPYTSHLLYTYHIVGLQSTVPQ